LTKKTIFHIIKLTILDYKGGVMDSQNANSSLDDNFFKSLADDNIFDLMGFTGIDDKKKEELVKTMVDTIRGRVLARIYDMLDETGRNDLERISEKAENDKLEEFFKSHNIKYEEMMAEEALIYKAEMIENAKLIKNQLKNNNKE